MNNTIENPHQPPVVDANENAKDFTEQAKSHLLTSVDNFIDQNQGYDEQQKEFFKAKVREAVDLALVLHSDQKPRPDGPYVNHILRVSNRVVEEYGVTDPELVMAAALHDSVEDQAEKLASEDSSEISNREKALAVIESKFDGRVAKIVSMLSNPEAPEEGKLTPEEKNEVYKHHVSEAIQDLDVLPIKLSDFSDNALNLQSVTDLPRRLKLSKKYLPVMKVFVERLSTAQSLLSPEKISEMQNRLEETITSTQEFIEQNS